MGGGRKRTRFLVFPILDEKRPKDTPPCGLTECSKKFFELLRGTDELGILNDGEPRVECGVLLSVINSNEQLKY
jgi:hypothetical protein